MAERAKSRRKVKPAACLQVRLIQSDLDLPQVMATVFAGYNVAKIFFVTQTKLFQTFNIGTNI